MEYQHHEDYIKKMFPFIDSITSTHSLHTTATPNLHTTATPTIVSANKMPFELLLSYKTNPCENMECVHYPRTTVANNQYLEDELKCHGYHHAKDQRRKPVRNLETFTGEFEYQANYFKEGRCPLAKEKYSQNFFESLYHPLYYKQFPCKRDHCDKSMYCPYFHNEREKMEWEVTFEQKLKVNRKMFLSTKTRQVQSPEGVKNLIGSGNGIGTSSSSSGQSDFSSNIPKSSYGSIGNADLLNRLMMGAEVAPDRHEKDNKFVGKRFNTSLIFNQDYNQFLEPATPKGIIAPAYIESMQRRY